MLERDAAGVRPASHWQVEKQFASCSRSRATIAAGSTCNTRIRRPSGRSSRRNDFDRLTERTKMVHNTRRKTQPWKSGLPVDFIPAETNRLFPPIGWLMRARRKLFGDYGLLGSYDFTPTESGEPARSLRECVEQGSVTPEMLREEMRQNHVRHDAFEVMERAPPSPPDGGGSDAPLELGGSISRFSAPERARQVRTGREDLQPGSMGRGIVNDAQWLAIGAPRTPPLTETSRPTPKSWRARRRRRPPAMALKKNKSKKKKKFFFSPKLRRACAPRGPRIAQRLHPGRAP